MAKKKPSPRSNSQDQKVTQLIEELQKISAGKLNAIKAAALIDKLIAQSETTQGKETLINFLTEEGFSPNQAENIFQCVLQKPQEDTYNPFLNSNLSKLVK